MEIPNAKQRVQERLKNLSNLSVKAERGVLLKNFTGLLAEAVAVAESEELKRDLLTLLNLTIDVYRRYHHHGETLPTRVDEE